MAEVKAFVGSQAGSGSYLWVAPASGIAVQPNHRVIAGDATTDGTVPVDQINETVVNQPYYAGTEITISGNPNAVVTVSVGAPGMDGAGLLSVNGQGQTATVTLNPQGQGTVRIQSTGMLPPGMGIVLPVQIEVQQSWWDTLFSGPAPKTSFNLAILPKNAIASTMDFVSKLGWGIASGNGDTTEAMVADISFSFIPVVGAYTDIRDVGKELLKLWPGGESPNYPALGFALAGIVTSFGFPGGDGVFTLAKQLAKFTDTAKGVFQTFWGLVKQSEFGKILEYTPTFLKMIAPGNGRLKDLAENVIKMNADRLESLKKLLNELGDEDTVQALDRIDKMPGLGAAAVNKVLDSLGKLTPAQLDDIKQAGSLDNLTESLGRGLKEEKLGSYLKWLNDRKTDARTRIPGASDKEHVVDEWLRDLGKDVQPNLLTNEWIGGAAGRQGDRMVNGIKTEIKSPKKTSDKGSISGNIGDATGQAPEIIVDVRHLDAIVDNHDAKSQIHGAMKQMRKYSRGKFDSINEITILLKDGGVVKWTEVRAEFDLKFPDTP
jgi:hypothetical protein